MVVVGFWATWCGPCKKSFPKYQEIADRFPNDVAVLAITAEDPAHVTKEKILATARDHGARFSILWDNTLRTKASYDAPPALPSMFVIDPPGVRRPQYRRPQASMKHLRMSVPAGPVRGARSSVS